MQWNQLDHYANNLHHINTQSLNFYRPDALPEAPTNSVKALKAIIIIIYYYCRQEHRQSTITDTSAKITTG